MRRVRFALPLAAALAASPAAAAPTAPPAAPTPTPDSRAKAMAVVARTKATRATYALYLWTRVSRAGETPRERLVANCRTGEGWAFSAETGERVAGPWIARTACGIDDNEAFEAAAWQGRVATRFGPADRVRLVTRELVKTYDVSADGILLACVYADRGAGGVPGTERLANRAVAVERRLPAADLFTPASLARSHVPARYTRPPRSSK